VIDSANVARPGLGDEILRLDNVNVHFPVKMPFVQRLLQREISTEFPASFLWLHSNWTLFYDAAACPAIAA